MTSFLFKILGVLSAFLISLSLFHAFGSTVSVQRGYPGVGMELVVSKDQVDEQVALNRAPPAFPAAGKDGLLAVDTYKNVKVLGHLSTGEFTRLMTAITTWVSPEQGCAYCHNTEDLASDELYTKVVSRRMIEMTMKINSDWKSHVKTTGVTCYTCHRGLNVPAKIWYEEPSNQHLTGMLGNLAGQNIASTAVSLTSLPSDPFTPFLSQTDDIRVVSTTALPAGNRASIKEAEWTYGLMMHMTDALGVNCVFCHNSRSMAAWDQSPVTRSVAWYGIRMVRDLNHDYLTPLKSSFPAHRLGPTGDAPKVNCATCHNGAYKPLLGVSMLKDYLELSRAEVQPQPKPQAPPETPPQPETQGAQENKPL